MGRKHYLYHATTPENAEKIKREGLKRKNGFCVYMSEKPFSWWKPGMTILRIRITGLKNLHVSPEDGLDEILSFEDISPLRIHEYEPTRSQWRKAHNHFREVTKMVEDEMKPKTYCEKWPSGCVMCDLLLCDGKKNRPAIKMYGPGELEQEATDDP